MHIYKYTMHATPSVDVHINKTWFFVRFDGTEVMKQWMLRVQWQHDG